ncbi:hypothetical protein CO610_05440 [Lysobacteraceae bacterium NML95-0200]|nr:hypothetical protein CO610_05440 [Xanthomonadaceae bacterium NML95-0200]
MWHPALAHRVWKADIESFNGKLRDERLNEHWFTSLKYTWQIIALRRCSYNQARPHSGCGCILAACFACST